MSICENVQFKVQLGLLRGANGGTVFKAIAIKDQEDTIQIELDNSNNGEDNNSIDKITFYINNGMFALFF